MKKQWFTVTPVHQHIYALAEFQHWEQVVSYLIIDRSRAFLVDTGMGYESIKKIVETVTSLPITVLLTHAHWDHIGSAHEFEDVFIFDNQFERQSLEKGFDSAEITELIDEKLFTQPFTPRRFSSPGKKQFQPFKDKEKIIFDSFTFEVIHTPGHTPGSTSFFIPELGALFTGDTIYPGPLYAQLPESNIQDYQQSIQKLVEFAHQDLLILPGHNSTTATNELLQEAQKLFENPISYQSSQISVLLPEGYGSSNVATKGK